MIGTFNAIKCQLIIIYHLNVRNAKLFPGFAVRKPHDKAQRATSEKCLQDMVLHAFMVLYRDFRQTFTIMYYVDWPCA